MLFCEKAELVDWWSSFRRLMFGPRHSVETCIKCWHSWGSSPGQISFPERNCVSACVTSCQPFLVPSRERGLGSLITRYAGFTPYLCPVFLVNSSSVPLWFNHYKVGTSVLSQEQPPRYGASQKGLDGLPVSYVDFQPVLVFSPLSFAFRSTFFGLQFLSFLPDKKDYFSLALSFEGG